jgi:hypothetical protein
VFAKVWGGSQHLHQRLRLAWRCGPVMVSFAVDAEGAICQRSITGSLNFLTDRRLYIVADYFLIAVLDANNVFNIGGFTMRKMLLITLAALSPLAFAGPECTTADKSEWKDKEAFQQNLKEEGYEIKKFKVTSGNCYEIYGWNKDKQKVEIYYNPVTGAVVKEEIED